MPCSEAAAERLFSVLKWIQSKDRLHMNIDLLRALLLIRGNDGFGHLMELFAGAAQR
jgi:hypothetical protein